MIPRIGALVVLLLSPACASEPQEDDVGGADSAQTAREEADVTWKPVSFEVPSAHAAKAAHEIFSSDDELRTFFGESCGILCTKKYEGPLAFAITDPPGKQGVAVYVNKPELPEGRELVIAGVGRRGAPKWLHVTTCTREGRGGSHALAVVELKRTLQVRWVSAPAEGEGLEPCR
jgi:hypothetical protein